MTIALSLIAAAVLIKTALLLAEQSPAVRRYALATCGAAQVSLGIVAAAIAAWATPVWAADNAPSAEAVAAAAPSGESPAKPAITVEPGKTVIIPPGRPEWVSADSAFNREPGAEWAAVVAGPCKTRSECEKELSDAVKAAADDYLNFHLNSQFAGKLLGNYPEYSANRLKNRLVSAQNTYAETIQVSFGPMEQIHARVHFDADFLKDAQDKWRDLKAKWRLAQVGVVAAVLLGLLGTASGFFKANTATGGQRTSILQFAAAGTILAIVAAGVTAAKYLYWF
jgi:hypothetical protein